MHTHHDAFLAALLYKGCQDGTVRQYESNWRVLAGWATDHRVPLSPTTWTADTLDRFLRWATVHLHWSPATRCARLSWLSSFSLWLLRAKVITDSPMLDERLSPPKRGERVPKAVAKSVVEAALALPDLTLEERAALALLYYTGLRNHEVCKLPRDGVSLEAGVVRIVGKGNRERVVPFGAKAAAILAAWMAGRNGGTRFLPGITRHRLDDLVGRVSRAVGVPLTPHVFRHSVATHLLEETGDLRLVQEFLGHKNIATTQVYTKVTDARKREAVERL